MMGRPFKCIHCGASDSSAKGYRMTTALGLRQIRRCRRCRRKFTPRHQRPCSRTVQSGQAKGEALDNTRKSSAPRDHAEADVVL